MSRPLQLMHLTRRLNTAADDGNWEALAKLDAELAAALPALAAQAPWSPAEQRMVGDLARAHTRARQACAAEAQRLEQLLVDMRTSREGWLAYGTSDEIGEITE